VVVFRVGHPLLTELVGGLFSQNGDHPFARRRFDERVSRRRRDGSECVSQSPDGLIELLGGSREGVAPVARIGHVTHRSGLVKSVPSTERPAAIALLGSRIEAPGVARDARKASMGCNWRVCGREAVMVMFIDGARYLSSSKL
jgi:hypothetical protein